jgi:hypothetical protein
LNSDVSSSLSFLRKGFSMKKVLLAAAAVGIFALGSTAFAQDDEKMWVSTAGGKHVVMGGTFGPEGSELLIGTGAKPADCAAGRFYTTDPSQQMVMACDNDAQYTLSPPESGVTMADGKPYAEGSMIMAPVQQ